MQTCSNLGSAKDLARDRLMPVAANVSGEWIGESARIPPYGSSDHESAGDNAGEIGEATAEQGIWLSGSSQLPVRLMSAVCGESAWAEPGTGDGSYTAFARAGGARAGAACASGGSGDGMGTASSRAGGARTSGAGAACASGGSGRDRAAAAWRDCRPPGLAEIGFRQGGVLDGLEPCAELAIFLQDTAVACAHDGAEIGERHNAGDTGHDDGRAREEVSALDGASAGVGTGMGMRLLDDDALTGVLRGWRRLGSWAAAMEHAAVAELAERRMTAAQSAGCWANEAERYASAEVAAALTLTRSAADCLVARALVLRGLAGTAGALAAGRIDMPRALVITNGVAGLAEELARAVEAEVLDKAPVQTTAELRRAVVRAVMAADPAAADLRREEAEKKARVERWAEPPALARSLAATCRPPTQLPLRTGSTRWPRPSSRTALWAGWTSCVRRCSLTCYWAAPLLRQPRWTSPSLRTSRCASRCPNPRPRPPASRCQPASPCLPLTSRPSVSLCLSMGLCPSLTPGPSVNPCPPESPRLFAGWSVSLCPL